VPAVSAPAPLRPPLRALLGSAAAGLALAAAPLAAQTGPPGVGYDISYPQCGKPFPVAPAFTIVGVNGGKPFTANPCLGAGTQPSELAWAGPGTAFYVNTSNPGPALSARWPIGQTAPLPCATASSPGTDTASCAYDYGWNSGIDAYATAVAAYRSLGWAPADATATPTPNAWWLDVEEANSWRSDAALNVAALQGQVAALSASGAAGVGLYSVASHWKEITGNTTAFAALPSWVAGPRTQAEALAFCAGPGFTGGGVAMAQFPSAGFDGNVRCPGAAPAPAPAPPLAIAFASPPPTLPAGGPSAPVTVALNGARGAPVSITLASSSAGGRFSAGPSGPWSPTMTVSIPPGGTAVSVTYRDTRAGGATIRASAAGATAVGQLVAVGAGPLAAIRVVPTGARLRRGAGQGFAVRGRDAYGNPVPTAARWSLTPGLGRLRPAVSRSTRLVAARPGPGVLTARAHGRVARARVVVR
jgi:hypothetical protein